MVYVTVLNDIILLITRSHLSITQATASLNASIRITPYVKFLSHMVNQMSYSNQQITVEYQGIPKYLGI